MKHSIFIITLFFSFSRSLEAQKIQFNYEITKGDTTLMGYIPEVVIKETPSFKTPEEYTTYLRYKRYAEKVYPYAVQAVKAYIELQTETKGMGYFERRRHIKEKQHELKSKFEDPLINLSKGQGKVLVKMIERKLNKPMYDVVDDSKGTFTAAYWNILGNMNGYKLKEGYTEGNDRILDLVIDDYNIPD